MPPARKAAILLWTAGSALLLNHVVDTAAAEGLGRFDRVYLPIGTAYLIGAGCWMRRGWARMLAFVFSAFYGGTLGISALVMLAGRLGPYQAGELAFVIVVACLVLAAGAILLKEPPGGARS